MTNTDSIADAGFLARIYGASELGVLSLTAPGDAHPRVEYTGGELFVGLDSADGTPVTEGEAAGWSRPFGAVVAATVDSARPLPAAQDGVVLIEDEQTAAAVLVEPARAAGAGVHGDPVLFALARDRVAIAGADDDAGIARVLDLADRLYEAGGPLVSAHPVTLAAGAWVPFAWRERTPALAMRFERVLRLFSVRAYDIQGVALRRPDVFVAEAKVRVLDTGVTTTFSTWPKGTATLLPVVDNVVVADPAGTVSVATFSEFLDAGGDAIVRTGLSPLRYFVPGHPPR